MIMSLTTTIVTAAASAWVGFSAYSVYARKPWSVDNLRDYGVPESWFPWLASLKLAGAVGLLAGVWAPAIGVAASIGVVLYFTGAMITVLCARAYSHVLYPLLYLAPAAWAGILLTNA
jgi:hypothetical protein